MLWSTYIDGCDFCAANTIEGAFAAQSMALIKPIVTKREQAAKLLAEAEELAERYSETRTFNRSPETNFHE